MNVFSMMSFHVITLTDDITSEENGGDLGWWSHGGWEISRKMTEY